MQKRDKRHARVQGQHKSAPFPAQRIHRQRVSQREQQHDVLIFDAHRYAELDPDPICEMEGTGQAHRAEREHDAVDLPRVPRQPAVIKIVPAEEQPGRQHQRGQREQLRGVLAQDAKDRAEQDADPRKAEDRRLPFRPVHGVERKTNLLRVAHLADGLRLGLCGGQTFGAIGLRLLLQMRPQLLRERRAHALPAHVRTYLVEILFDAFGHITRLLSARMRRPSCRRATPLPFRTDACGRRPSGGNIAGGGPRRTPHPAR